MENLKMELNVVENDLLLVDSKVFKSQLKVRKAQPKDVQGIYNVAYTVGKSKKDSTQGFLMDDYSSDPKYFQKKILENILKLEHFYIAETINNKVVGFLMAYTKDLWLEHDPNWIKEVNWHPSFDMKRLDNFVVIDKTAIYAPLTGRGIGSRLYKSLISDILSKGIHNIFAETIINPVPNFASLSFREKQNYILAGTRYYEAYKDTVYTDLIYYKSV
ncbi:Acetyltransferase (GNAT) family protein [Natronincola peptidivorans]|uniref:Acetyltransferase (GNAT) family protein n=1 Tax=Natronincola peptidivorans TaxID=426128 RepID=A0A1I0GWK3_9FIRM|nr:GNAT family N-acetyltransferase [Natronincola peptidivorans]SET75570.1 Acetyltransferase (GNAT) family protein [Natronincola peptidivorans]